MEYVRIAHSPELRQPVLIAAFAGWNDAGGGATMAARVVRRQHHGERFAHIEAEEFFDFTSTRPTVRLTAGATRRLDWPANDFYSCPLAAPRPDLALLIGTEPHLRWQTFTAAVLGVARQLDVQQVITLGALLTDVPHTRPSPVSGGSADPDLAARLASLDMRASHYEGPTGIVGVLSATCQREGIAAASLWASAPHYLQAQPNPAVALALLSRLDALLNLDLNLDRLRQRAQAFIRQVDEAVEDHPEIRDYVRRLEEQAGDEGDETGELRSTGSADLPSGEALVEELEQFLRRNRTEDDE